MKSLRNVSRACNTAAYHAITASKLAVLRTTCANFCGAIRCDDAGRVRVAVVTVLIASSWPWTVALVIVSRTIDHGGPGTLKGDRLVRAGPRPARGRPGPGSRAPSKTRALDRSGPRHRATTWHRR